MGAATGVERWRANWLVVAPGDAVHAVVERTRGRRRTVERTLRELPAGTAVVLAAEAPLAYRRCRAFGSCARVEAQLEYLAFPSATAPAYLVEDAPAALRLFVRTALAAPPGSPWAAPLEVCFAVLRAPGAWRLVRLLAPRIVVGRRA